MTVDEQREASRQFIMKWAGKGKEDEDDRSFWIDIFQRILGVEDATDKIDFQKKVLVGGNTKRIDAYIPETRIIIEQKSLGRALDKKTHNSGDINLTPYEQAKRYNDNLPYDEKARYIVTSNFSEIWIYDMNKRDPEAEIEKIQLIDLQRDFPRLKFLVNQEATKISREMEVSIQAGEIVGVLYDELYKNYADPNEETLKSLNKLCVRLVFCMYAEDAGLFKRKDMFHDYLVNIEPKYIRRALLDLFRILDTPEEERDLDEDVDLLEFPYVNGGLFSDEDIKIPQFTDELKEILLQKASNDFDWSEISPTIFGAIFESTLNPETRRSGGMHYTSIENIHKVIDPLFLDELKEEFEECKKKTTLFGHRENALKEFQDKLASLTFLDPAAGSGNFLTESYTSLRKLENQVIRLLQNDLMEGQKFLENTEAEKALDIKVSIQQFYGIEVNDFAVTVAKTALWIAEAQMMKETLSFADIDAKFLPLKSYVNIIEANALRTDWNEVLPASKCSYIMGNPPFVGYSLQTKEQKADIQSVYIDGKGKVYKTAGKVDYVACWYFKAAEYIMNTMIKVAFVSTNSITQGEQVEAVWKPIYERFGIQVEFAHRTFRWDSEASLKAHVHCVIIGFDNATNSSKKKIYQENNILMVDSINPYLLSGEPVFIESRKKPICAVPQIVKGSSPVDGGNLLLKESERDDLLLKNPGAEKFIRRFYGAKEYLHNIPRYCLWLEGILPEELNKLPYVKERVMAVKNFRSGSTKEATRKYADYPLRFMEIRQPDSDYILIPRHSSENRRYIPMGFLSPDEICGDANIMMPNATLYHFGVLMSNVHMAWVRAVCGRLEMRYRYSNDIVYNNFPWCSPTDEQKQRIEQTAQCILDARSLYPNSSLSDLYDEISMPPELRKAHLQNDKAVMQAYGFSIKDTTEEDCVAALMKMYQDLLDLEI